MRQTPLHALHRSLDAKMVGFAGWEMPVSYPSGLIAEHTAARTGAALFDVSHMFQAMLVGPGAAAALERLVPGNIATLAPGKAVYTQLLTADGGIVDDLIASNTDGGLYLVMNAARRDADMAYLADHLPGGVALEGIEGQALIAVQGPDAAGMVTAIAPVAGTLGFMETAAATIDGAPAQISRLGYTGEDGFEISVPADRAAGLADRVIAAGAVPAGLGARDSLRMEAGLCLYGQDIDEHTSPVEAGLGWSIPKRRRAEGGFLGADRILAELRDGPTRRLVGIRPEGRAPARAGTEIVDGTGRRIGHVTSGGFSPTLNAPISMGYVEADHAGTGTEVTLMIRGKPHGASVAALPFVPHRYHRKG